MPKARLTKAKYKKKYRDALPEYWEPAWQDLMHDWSCSNLPERINPALPVERMEEAAEALNAHRVDSSQESFDKALELTHPQFIQVRVDVSRRLLFGGETMADAHGRLHGQFELPESLAEQRIFFARWVTQYFQENNIPIEIQRGFFNHYNQSLNPLGGLVSILFVGPTFKEPEDVWKNSFKSAGHQSGSHIFAENGCLYYEAQIDEVSLKPQDNDSNEPGHALSNLDLRFRYRVTETGYELEYIESATPLGGLLIDLMHQPTAQLSERVMAEEAFSRWNNPKTPLALRLMHYLRAAHGKPLSYEVLSELVSPELLVSSEIAQYRQEHAKQHFFQSLWEQFRRFIGWPNRRDCILDQLPEVFLREVETGDSTAFNALQGEAQTHFASDTLLTGLFTSLSEVCGVGRTLSSSQRTNAGAVLGELGANSRGAVLRKPDSKDCSITTDDADLCGERLQGVSSQNPEEHGRLDSSSAALTKTSPTPRR